MRRVQGISNHPTSLDVGYSVPSVVGSGLACSGREVSARTAWARGRFKRREASHGRQYEDRRDSGRPRHHHRNCRQSHNWRQHGDRCQQRTPDGQQLVRNPTRRRQTLRETTSRASLTETNPHVLDESLYSPCLPWVIGESFHLWSRRR